MKTIQEPAIRVCDQCEDVYDEYKSTAREAHSFCSESCEEKWHRKHDEIWNDLGNTLYEMGNEEPEW